MKKKWLWVVGGLLLSYFIWANTFLYLRDDNRLYWVWHPGRSAKVLKFSAAKEYSVPFAFSARSLIRKYDLRSQETFVRWLDKTMDGYIIMADKTVIFALGGR